MGIRLILSILAMSLLMVLFNNCSGSNKSLSLLSSSGDVVPGEEEEQEELAEQEENAEQEEDFEVVEVVDTNFRPCGDNPTNGGTLWSWAWAGAEQQYLTLSVSGDSSRVARMEDLSGNNHFYFTNPNRPRGHASELGGYTWELYSTPYPTIGLHRSEQTNLNYFGQNLLQNGSLEAGGEFYLAVALMNTRTGRAGRQIFGAPERGNVLSYSQGVNDSGSLYLTIDGNGERITEDAYGLGPLLIEVWRDSNNIVQARVNGVDSTRGGGVLIPGMFDMTGLSGENSSAFHDAGFEFIVCKGATAPMQMDQVRDYLRSKWNLY